MLAQLFWTTLRTALISHEAFLFMAAHHFLVRRGLLMPEDVSLGCSDADSSFAWCVLPTSHIRGESGCAPNANAGGV